MKKLFVLFAVVGFLTACNNNNPFASKDKNNSNREKTEKDDRKGVNENNEAGRQIKDDYMGKDDTRSNWTTNQRDKWLNDCIDASGNNPNARKVCSCVLEKLEKKYPDSKDAENASEAEGTRLAKACMEDLGINGGANEQDRNQTEGRNDETDNSGGRGWTDLQRRQYIQGCETTARKNPGYTAQQVSSYCDCMTRKVERKYSFLDAAKMTAADFQTKEWQNAAADCMPNN